jgi:hypothetical protein
MIEDGVGDDNREPEFQSGTGDHIGIAHTRKSAF